MQKCLIKFPYTLNVHNGPLNCSNNCLGNDNGYP